MDTTINQRALELHRKHVGKLGTTALIPVTNKDELSLAYTPGVAEPCRVIHKNPEESFALTSRGRTVAVISDGSAVLGLGNIGAEAALPVMEGKALLMKTFAGIDAVPLVINTQNPEEVIRFVRAVAPTFAGINLEDIAAPNCFQVEDALQDLGIAVFHDDQHGTAIVVTAALQNAAKVVGKKFEDLKVVVVGAGSAGIAISRMLLGIECMTEGCSLVTGARAVKDVILVDSHGAISKYRAGMNVYKQVMAGFSNKENKTGDLDSVIAGADVVIGVSRPDTITANMVKSMADNAIVFALANPDSEILPQVAKEAGAAVVATGRSDHPNQINNVLAFPGVFKAVIDGRLPRVTTTMKQAAARKLAELVDKPTAEQVLPTPFTLGVASEVSKAILAVAAL